MTWVQIIDDDYWCGEAIIANLMTRFKTVRFEIKEDPEADDGRDIYIVDNEFKDGDHGERLVKTIRQRNPDSTIILCTGTKDRINIRDAMNAGCNALIEKGSMQGRQELADIIGRHVERTTRSSFSPSLISVLADIKSIIAAWNTRLALDEPAVSAKD